MTAVRFLPGAPVPPPALSPSGAGARALPPPFLDAWERALARWDAPPATREALRRLDAGAPVVVTGQQPGVWGGPLYSLYKAATAVALAGRSGAAGIAVFWIGADDTDWDEVGWGVLPRPDLSLARSRWENPLGPRRWIGGAAPETHGAAAETFAAWGRDIPPPAGIDLGDAFARFLLERLGGHGLLPLDAREPELRRAARPLWERWAAAGEAIATAVIEEGSALLARGLPAPIAAETARHGLFVLDGDARRPIDPSTTAGDVETILAGGDAARLAPSVLLRAPLQDRLLAPVAHVVGAGEEAYLRQLAPVYRALGVPEPARVLRLSGVLVPAGMAEPGAETPLVDDPEGEAARRAAGRIPEAAAAALAALRDATDRALAPSDPATAGFPRDVAETAEAARRKIHFQLGRIDEALERRARQSLYAAEPRWRNLPEFLRPRRGEQDRGLSGLAADLLLGPAAAETVLDAARGHLHHLAGGVRSRALLEFDLG